MKNFKQIRLVEKSVKGITIPRYLVNPTGLMIANFTKNIEDKAIRVIDYKGTLYVWGGYFLTHIEFLQQELLTTLQKSIEISKGHVFGEFQPETNGYNYCGGKLYENHKQVIDIAIGHYENIYSREFILDEDTDNGKIFSWESIEKGK